MKKEIVIGWNRQQETDLTNQAAAVSLAYRRLVAAYQEQEVPFSLDVEQTLLDVSSEVVLGGSREVSMDKKLDLLGINATMLRNQANALNDACTQFGIEANQLTESGEVPSKILKERIKSDCEIVAVGEWAVELAETLNDVAKSMSAFYDLMAKGGCNRPSAYAVTQATHNILYAVGEGVYAINPSAFQIYSRV